MKKDLWLGAVFLTAFLLGACAMNLPIQNTAPTVTEANEISLPAAETEPSVAEAEMTEQEKAVAQCRAVLDAVQRGTHYKITLTRWYEGVWDQTQRITYLRSGDNRAICSKSSGDDHDGEYLSWYSHSVRLGFQGNVYHAYALTGEPMEWEGPLTGEKLNFDPWMYTFDWDAQQVDLESIQKTKDGRSITFRVAGTYPNDRVLSESYTITFYFDEEGNFIERELTATGVQQTFFIVDGNAIASGEPVEDSRILTRVDHVTIESLDPDVCTAEIDALYQEALAFLNAKP